MGYSITVYFLKIGNAGGLDPETLQNHHFRRKKPLNIFMFPENNKLI